MLALLLLAQQTAMAAVLAGYRTQTRAEVPCRTSSDETEIVVCARRQADRYRLPLIPPNLGRDSDAARLNRLIGGPMQQGSPPCGEGAFMVKCDKVGVTGAISPDGKVRMQQRELAP